MALWKPFRGNRQSLDTQPMHDGYVYFCTDDGSLFFDYADADGNLQRKQISAKDEISSIWSLIKSYCDLGIANSIFKAGMQVIDHSPVHGDVVFDVVNVTPTEVVIQTHDVIGEPLYLGYFEEGGDYYMDDVYVYEKISAGETFCIQWDSYWNGELGEVGYYYEWFVASQDIPAGSYTYNELCYELSERGEEPEDTEAINTFIVNEHYDDIVNEPEILLEDYVQTIHLGFSSDFVNIVGQGFIPRLEEIGGQTYDGEVYDGVWQYYANCEDLMSYGETCQERSKRDYWAFNLDGIVQDSTGEHGYFYANSVNADGSHEEAYEYCYIAPAFKIGTPYEGEIVYPTKGNIAVFDAVGNVVDGGNTVEGLTDELATQVDTTIKSKIVNELGTSLDKAPNQSLVTIELSRLRTLSTSGITKNRFDIYHRLNKNGYYLNGNPPKLTRREVVSVGDPPILVSHPIACIRNSKYSYNNFYNLIVAECDSKGNLTGRSCNALDNGNGTATVTIPSTWMSGTTYFCVSLTGSIDTHMIANGTTVPDYEPYQYIRLNKNATVGDHTLGEIESTVFSNSSEIESLRASVVQNADNIDTTISGIEELRQQISEIPNEFPSEIPNEVYIGDGEMPEDAKIQIIVDGSTETNGTTTLPDYWEEHLAEKISSIKALQRQGGKDCFSFVLMTDIHYPTNLGKRSPAIAKRIMGNCNIKYALNCGDMQSRGSLETKEDILAENEQINEMFSPIKDRLLQVVGNHDGAYGWSGGTANSGSPYVKQLNENEMFEEYIRANGLNGDVHFDKNSLAFYVDDVSNKVRYIGLDSMNVPNKPTDVDENGFALYPKIYVTHFLQAQYGFLCNDALVTVPSDDWCVVVFGHSGIYQSRDFGVMVDLLSAYKNKTLCVSDYEGTPLEVENFTNLFDVNGDGFNDNAKQTNVDGGGVSEQDATYTFITNEIPAYFNKTSPCVLRIGGVPEEYRGNLALVLYDANGKNLCSTINISSTSDFVLGDDGVYTWDVGKLGNYMSTTQCGTTSYLKITSHNKTLDTLIVTVDEEIDYTEGQSYDAVSVNADFTDAKGQFIAYFHGHNHKDDDYVRYSKDASRTMVDIGTRCDGHQENVDGKDETVEDDTLYNERVAGTITEQSFDVFTVNKATKTIHATKIGAGSDRTITY